MKKKLIAAFLVMAMSVTSLTGCGGDKNTETNTGTNTESGAAVEGAIQAEHLDLGDGFDAEYYPDESQTKLRQGKIDIVLLFEGTETGWQALADEYNRLHGGQVAVVLNTDYSSSTYPDALKYEITSNNTDWDIVMGNYIASQVSQTCINMYSYLNEENSYAGNHAWVDVLQEDAYITDKTGATTSTYIMNSENLWTAWFVNKVALEAAGEKGYKNANGEVANPTTWEDLINLCKYMQEAGYENPLGISLSESSVTAEHFSWLLRVYGDYYWRNEYDKIMVDDSEFQLDMTDENPESNIEYAIDSTKFFNLLLDESSENYVGANSEKFKEFLGNFEEMKPYLDTVNGTQATMTDLRNEFKTQSSGKESPQILLDYLGTGLMLLNSDAEGLEVDFFDYPTMESKGGYVPEGMLTRDVGGNGGYLSIINHKAAQNELNLDFMKFVMSPYGQSIYYNALSETDFAPQGITLVRQELVTVPDVWTEFFKTDAITFTGLSDNSEFVRYLTVGFGEQDVKGDLTQLWQKYLVGVGNDVIDTDQFASAWKDVSMTAWTGHSGKMGWNVNCYKYPGQGTEYGGE